jgi:hypothetical protein
MLDRDGEKVLSRAPAADSQWQAKAECDDHDEQVNFLPGKKGWRLPGHGGVSPFMQLLAQVSPWSHLLLFVVMLVSKVVCISEKCREIQI